MDLILKPVDDYFFTPYFYPSSLPEDNAWRQFLSVFLVTCVGGCSVYLMTSTIDYLFLFDPVMDKNPHRIKNQVRKEILYSMKNFPMFAFLAAGPLFLEVRGYSQLYDRMEDSNFGWLAIPASIIMFVICSDFIIYWAHRFLHLPLIYRLFHKPHHQWRVPTPFASFAQDPVDGFIMGLPYHSLPLILPMHKATFLLAFLAANVWTASVHDGLCCFSISTKSIINGPAHHHYHHFHHEGNYGQYFSFWDKLCGTYRHPFAHDENKNELMIETNGKRKNI